MMTEDKRTWGPKPRYEGAYFYKRPPEHRDTIISVAGPCSIETPEQVGLVLRALKEAGGVTYVRGGPWSYGTYPPLEPGLRDGDLTMFANAVHDAGMRCVVECLDIRLLDLVAARVDAIQIGARQAQNYPLLIEVGKVSKAKGSPVFLKRGVGMTVDEWLGAAEYIIAQGANIILVERGSATYHNHVRWGVDITAIAYIAEKLDIPVLVDGSHGTGRRDLVAPVTLAGIAAGASGFVLECHPWPEKSKSDAEQAFPLAAVKPLFDSVKAVWGARRATKFTV